MLGYYEKNCHHATLPAAFGGGFKQLGLRRRSGRA